MYPHFCIKYTDGNAIPFEEVVHRYTPSLTAFAFGFIKNREGAKDIVQDVFLHLWQNKPTFHDEEHLKRSLYISVKNASLNTLRSLSRHRNHIKNIEHEDTPDPSLAMMEQEVIRLLIEAIHTLPERTAEVLKRTLQGYKQEEIANHMGIAISSVKTMKRTGIDKIRKICRGDLHGRPLR